MNRLYLTLWVPCVLAFLGIAVIFLWSNWNWNLEHDLIFSRTNSPVFPEAHSLSILAMLLGSVFLVIKRDSVVYGVILGFSTASIHDLTWAACGLATVGYSVESGLHYLMFEAVCLGLAVYIAGPRDRRTMGLMLIPMVAYYLGSFFIPPGLAGTLINSPNGTAPWKHSIYFYSVKDNIGEIVAWAIGPAVWIARG